MQLWFWSSLYLKPGDWMYPSWLVTYDGLFTHKSAQSHLKGRCCHHILWRGVPQTATPFYQMALVLVLCQKENNISKIHLLCTLVSVSEYKMSNEKLPLTGKTVKGGLVVINWFVNTCKVSANSIWKASIFFKRCSYFSLMWRCQTNN